jgi:hypothetical protein
MMINRWLTPRRRAYAWLTAIPLWTVWLISVLFGPGRLDLAGQAVGTDYLQFYAAGETLRRGDSAQLYNITYQSALEQEIIGPALTSYHAFITPPFLAALYAPFAALPYGLSFALWSALQLALLWGGLRLLTNTSSWQPFAWALTWFPVFASVSFGQNGLLSFFLLALTYRLWHDKRGWMAGLTCSLLLYKPQLTLGVAALWLWHARRDWRSLFGFGLGGALLAGLSFGLLPQASRSYIDFALNVLPDLPSWQDFPIWHLHTVRGFWRLLLPWWPQIADVFYLGLGMVGVWTCVRFWRRQPAPTLQFAAAVCLTLWVTPHAMIYDWVVLLIPATLLWHTYPQHRERWRGHFASLWIATLFASPITYLQLQVSPAAMQISIPYLTLTLYRLQRFINQHI